MTKVQKYKYKSYEEFQAIRHHLKGTGQPDYFRLGASDIGTVLGLNEFKSTIAFFYECCDWVPSRFEPTLDTHRGHVLEHIAYERYWKYMDPSDPSPDTYLKNFYGPKKIFRRARKSNTIYVSPEYDWLFVSPDYQFTDKRRRGVLEIKFPRGFNANRYADGVSAEHVAQVQFQMYVGGFQLGELLSMDDATYPKLFTWEPIKEKKDELIEITRQYAINVLKGKQIVYSDMDQFEKEQALAELAPDETNDMKYCEFLKEHHKPENAKAVVEGTEEQLQIVCDYLRLKEYEPQILKKENEIREFFTGGIGQIQFPGLGKISWQQKLSVPKSILKKYEEMV